MTTDTGALTERIARALYENAEYYGPEDVQPAWEHRDDEERGEWIEIATAVLPIVAEEVRKAKAEALREAANDPALRLSGHSGISITRLRARAAAQGPTDAAREALDGLVEWADLRVREAVTDRGADDWRRTRSAVAAYRDRYHPEEKR